MMAGLRERPPWCATLSRLVGTAVSGAGAKPVGRTLPIRRHGCRDPRRRGDILLDLIPPPPLFSGIRLDPINLAGCGWMKQPHRGPICTVLKTGLVRPSLARRKRICGPRRPPDGRLRGRMRGRSYPEPDRVMQSDGDPGS